jgi:hypothetical protein
MAKLLSNSLKGQKEMSEESKSATFEHTQQCITTRYELQQDGHSVKRVAIGWTDRDGFHPNNKNLSSWKWGKDGWTGDLSRSNAGYEVAKAFGFITHES